nr:hypothetical protein [Tanacetum cinerariifolium]
MSSGSQTVGDAVVSKFDMHIYNFVLTSDEVKNLVAEYAIPLDLHPCVPPSGLTMNGLPADKIDPPLTGVRAEEICRLCKNLIDLRPVHPAMLYAIGLTTIWKHVRHHPVFKDGEGTGNIIVLPLFVGVHVGKGTTLVTNEVIPQCTTQPLPSCAQILEKSDHQKVVEYENEMVLVAKRKTQAAKDKATGKRSAAEGTSYHNVDLATGEDSLVLESVGREEDDADRGLDNVKDGTEADSPPVNHPFGSQHSDRSDEDTHVHSDGLHHDEGDEQAHRHASGSFTRRAFPKRNLSGDGAGSSAFMVRACRGALAQIDLLQRYESLNDDNGELYESHRSCGDEHLGCAGKEAGLVENLVVVKKEKDDLLDKSREQEERIRRLKEELASKTSSLTEAESSVSTLKGDLEYLTVDLSHAEIIRHTYAIAVVWSEGVKVERTQEDAEAILAGAADYDPHCKDTFMSAFDSLLTQSYLYVEKLAESFCLSLGDLQYMWPEGANGFGCKLIFLCSLLIVYTFWLCSGDMRHLAIGTWTHPKRLVFHKMYVTWPLALGVIWSVLRFRKCTSLGHWHLDKSGASCFSRNVCQLAIGTWTHPERLAIRDIYVTWPLALGLIRSVLRFKKCTSLGH